MTTKEKYKKVLAWFKQTMPVAETELHYANHFQLLISVMLTAQCTDKRVNMVTPALFSAFPTPEILADSSEETVYEYIKSISYPNNKAHYLVEMAKMLVTEFNGLIPSTVEELIRLPGVGKKTANVIVSIAFGIPALAVDTHVFRVANRIGLTNDSKTPSKTEKELTKHIPKHLWSIAHHWLILHGRYICSAQKPKCENCGLNIYCKYYKIRVLPIN